MSYTSRAELNDKFGAQVLQHTHNSAVEVIRQERPTWTSDMVREVGWDIMQRIDWDNAELMHKGFACIVRQYLNALCPV